MIRLTERRKKIITDFFENYQKFRFHEDTDRRFRPFDYTREFGCPVLIDGVLFQEEWASTNNEFSFSDPAGEWQIVFHSTIYEFRLRSPQTTLGAFDCSPPNPGFDYLSGERNLRKTVYIRSDQDHSETLDNLLKWMKDKSFYLKLFTVE